MRPSVFITGNLTNGTAPLTNAAGALQQPHLFFLEPEGGNKAPGIRFAGAVTYSVNAAKHRAVNMPFQVRHTP